MQHFFHTFLKARGVRWNGYPHTFVCERRGSPVAVEATLLRSKAQQDNSRSDSTLTGGLMGVVTFHDTSRPNHPLHFSKCLWVVIKLALLAKLLKDKTSHPTNLSNGKGMMGMRSLVLVVFESINSLHRLYTAFTHSARQHGWCIIMIVIAIILSAMVQWSKSHPTSSF